MAFLKLKKLLDYLPEFLALLFLVVILWILFLPHLESPFRIKLNLVQAKQIFLLSLLATGIVFFANYLIPAYNTYLINTIIVIIGLNFIFSFLYFLSILSILNLPFDKISHRFGVIAQPLWSLFFCTYCALLGLSLYYYKNSIKEREYLQKREKELQEVSLLSLKNQLNPHFLFNILNNIDAHILRSPAFASDMLVQLSKLMRYIIYEDKMLALSKEINFIEQYIELQLSRHQNKIKCIFEKEIEDENIFIAPAIFLPYIENAFKYCDLSKKINTIYFSLKQTNKELVFVAENPSSPLIFTTKNEGKGLEIANKRLQVFYRNHYDIILHKNTHLFSVKIKIWNN